MSDKNNNQIVIVYATNDSYAPYMGVSMYSLIKNTTDRYFYKICVLQEDLTESHKRRIEKLAKDNVVIEFVDVSEKMRGKIIPQIGHLSKETTYRLLSDEIFAEYEKILYIDCDTIIMRDVAELYNEDLTDCIVGASLGNLHTNMIKYITERLHLSTDGYFNAGVLLINIPMFKQCNIGKKCFELLQSDENYWTMDQDVLNITCQGKVKYFDGRWNVEWAYLLNKEFDFVQDEERTKKLDYVNKPYIVHYTSAYKPWAYPGYQLAELFWKNARDTEFYEEILFNNIKIKEPQKQTDSFRRFIFPWEAIKPKDAIVIYGAGVVGKIFIEQIEMSQYCSIIAVCDKKYDEIKNMSVPVVSIEEVADYNCDKIIIAIERKDIAMEIMNELEGKGIEREKIFWHDYRRK